MARSMMMNPAELTKLGNQVINQSNQFLDEVKAVFNLVQSIETSPDWQGDDMKAFVQTVRGYQGDLNNLGQVIGNYGRFLIQAASGTSNTNQAIAQAARRL